MVKTDIELFNLKEGEQLSSPCYIIHGKCSTQAVQSIQVQHPQLPPLTFPVNSTHFKATVLLTPGENRLTLVTNDNRSYLTVVVYYSPPLQNIPVHLCLIVGKDSPLVFDSPAVQQKREGGHGLDLAIQKLRVGARMMQAFTNEQMMRNGFGQRTFRFAEEYAPDTLFDQTPDVVRNTVKIHIIRSSKTTAEIQDPDVAQQNSNGKRTGDLFSWALDSLKEYGGPFTVNNGKEPLIAACIYLDTHWDGKLIRGHAALGGGTENIRLAIFGSHGLYSWPTSMEKLIPYLLDGTKVSTNEVANDANECGTHWECLNVTLGAFMHEIGHSLGSPHQVSGVMLRDYITLNRSFLTKEAYSIRTKSYGAQVPIYPKEECTWHRLDLLRYLYHPAFTLPQDFYDPTFMRPSRIAFYKDPDPTVYPLADNSCVISCATGIYGIEIICDDLARAFIEYLPKSLGGVGPQKEVHLSLNKLRSMLPEKYRREYSDTFNLKVLAVNCGDIELNEFPKTLAAEKIQMEKYGFSKNMIGIKSAALGSPHKGQSTGIIAVDISRVASVRVYHGYALDGIRFYYNSNSVPTIPPRTYMGDKSQSSFTNAQSVLFGNETGSFTDFTLEPGELVQAFNFRCGAWLDAVQIVTSKNRQSAMLGNKDGGHQAQLKAPKGQMIVGFFGTMERWVQSIGIVYSSTA